MCRVLCFSNMSWSNPQNNHMKWVLFESPYFRWGNRDIEIPSLAWSHRATEQWSQFQIEALLGEGPGSWPGGNPVSAEPGLEGRNQAPQMSAVPGTKYVLRKHQWNAMDFIFLTVFREHWNLCILLSSAETVCLECAPSVTIDTCITRYQGLCLLQVPPPISLWARLAPCDSRSFTDKPI